MTIVKGKKIEYVQRNQLLLRPVNVEELVAEDDAVRAIWELSGRLDLSGFYADIQSEEGAAGREAIDPRLLVSLWVYAYSQGVSSAREISRLMGYHPGFQWLSGIRVINHHTLSSFRIDHHRALNDLFTEMLGLLSNEGLLTLERVMHDGTKIKANASGKSFRRQERLKEHLRLAREHVEAMGDPRSTQEVTPRVKAARQRAARERQQRLEDALNELHEIQKSNRSSKEQRVSSSDPDARIMKQAGGGYGPSYNVQLTTDAQAGVIAEISVSQSPMDAGQLPEAADRLEKRLGKKPQKMVADAEYTTHPTIVEMENKGIDFIGSVRSTKESVETNLKRHGIDPAFGPDVFIQKSPDIVQCPRGKDLKRKRTATARYYKRVFYQAEKRDCLICPFQKKCCPKSFPRVVGKRHLNPLIAAFKKRMSLEPAKSIYKQRAPVAEFTNAWLKEKLRLRQFRLRGQTKVTLETFWACLTTNIQLWIRHRWRPNRAFALT